MDDRRILEKITLILSDPRVGFGLALLISALTLLCLPASGVQNAEQASGWDQPLSEQQKIVQLLNRITFGPRPGDVERVRKTGRQSFLERQLHPERIDDSFVEARIAALPTLTMSSAELVEDFPPPKRPRQLAEAGMTMTDDVRRPRQILIELAREQIWRSVYGERQLEEEMVQFWMNHFNIFAPKGADRWLLTAFERDTIRPHALGRFEDLLVATAKSPAMLFYLDNWLSAAPNRQPRNRQGLAIRRSAGLNENYARELMELHTLGVDGGYSQKDVSEVARAFTGWTLDRPRRNPEFLFNPRMHDSGGKSVLGQTIAAGGSIDDGLAVLHLLAREPATARFISLKLCRRFIADEPPRSIVDRAGRKFLDSDGDLRAVLESILTSPEFFSRAAFRAKVKSPIELVASALRAFGGETDAGKPLLRFVGRMGQPMFQYQAPTGFPDRAETWVDPSELLFRMKFAAALASNRIPGTTIDPEKLQPAESKLWLDDDRDLPPPRTGDALRSPQALAALVLASPEFQHH